MKAYIINIGDEILLGQILNTNAHWMAQELQAQGVDLQKILTISDERQAIIDSLDQAKGQADLVLITGGLGPTKDDITKFTLADYFGMSLAFHAPSFQNIEHLFEQFGRNRQPDDRYKVQAEMPVGAQILINKMGTASGMWFQEEGYPIVVSMPGVPKEMKYLMQEEVFPRLAQLPGRSNIVQQTWLCFGKGETDVSTALEDFEAQLPSSIKLAYLPNTKTGYLRLRLTAKGQEEAALVQAVKEEGAKLCEILGPKLIIGQEGDFLEAKLGELLRQKGKTIGTAESCTGGNIAHKLTTIPGSSDYFMGSVVAYSNTVKMQQLGVSAETLETEGAVSEATVRQMLAGLIKNLNVDYGIVSSGIAGPSGGRPDKPVGTIWLAMGSAEKQWVQKLELGNNRTRNIEMSSSFALNFMRLFLLEDAK